LRVTHIKTPNKPVRREHCRRTSADRDARYRSER
jgi:hypothetical protein